jgi:hypothetical protein
MIRLLAYIIIITIIILGVYLLGPNSGTVEIYNDNFRIETSISVFIGLAALGAVMLSLLISFIFWLVGLQTKIKNSLNKFFYKRKVLKMLDLLDLVYHNKLREASKKYDLSSFTFIEHEFLDEIRQKISSYKKKESK